MLVTIQTGIGIWNIISDFIIGTFGLVYIMDEGQKSFKEAEAVLAILYYPTSKAAGYGYCTSGTSKRSFCCIQSSLHSSCSVIVR